MHIVIGRATSTIWRLGYIENISQSIATVATMTHLLYCRLLDDPSAPVTSSPSQNEQRLVPGSGNTLKDTRPEEDQNGKSDDKKKEVKVVFI